MKQFFKLHKSVLEETQNIVQSCIVALIVSMAKGKNECIAQKTWMAKQLYISRATFERNIKALEEMELIKSETIYTLKNGELEATTHFTLTEKLQNLIGANENEQPQPPTTTSLQNDVAKPIASQQKPIAKKNDDVDLYHYDFFIPLMMKQQNERRGEVC